MVEGVLPPMVVYLSLLIGLSHIQHVYKRVHVYYGLKVDRINLYLSVRGDEVVIYIFGHSKYNI